MDLVCHIASETHVHERKIIEPDCNSSIQELIHETKNGTTSYTTGSNQT